MDYLFQAKEILQSLLASEKENGGPESDAWATQLQEAINCIEEHQSLHE